MPVLSMCGRLVSNDGPMSTSHHSRVICDTLYCCKGELHGYLKAGLACPVCMLVEGPHICQAGMQVQGLRYNDGYYEQG